MSPAKRSSPSFRRRQKAQRCLHGVFVLARVSLLGEVSGLVEASPICEHVLHASVGFCCPCPGLLASFPGIKTQVIRLS